MSESTFRKVYARQIVAVILFYLFFSVLYHIVLWSLNEESVQKSIFGWVNLRSYWNAAGMQYSFFFVASIFIWFIGIWLLKQQKTFLQIIAVSLLIPIVLYFVRELRYQIVDSMGLFRLEGTGTVWDWYIPTLFLFIQFGCYFAYRYFRENQKKLRVEGELRQAALKSELSAIKAQLNPHFLYNVFNTINVSIPEENEKTRHMIAQLADLFRYQLMASKTELVSLHEELDFVTKYLELEKARFEDRLQVEINVSEDLLSEKVPPLLLQPLVENSIKHGLASLIEGGKVSITIFKEGDMLKFEVADTGVGLKNKSDIFNKGVGLINTKLRLQKMYNSSLTILDNQPRGLKIQFSL